MLRPLFIGILLWGSVQAEEDFRCAWREEMPRTREAAKVTGMQTTGSRHALMIFAQFRAELPGWERVPEWSADLFDADRPGSFSHFYRTMSFDQLRISGVVAPRPYTSQQPASAYLSDDPLRSGGYGAFCREILEQVDREMDLTRFDNDGPDGIANSGDDDGYVDAVFFILASAPRGFLRGPATGIANLGVEADWATDDLATTGEPIRVSYKRGTIQQGRTFSEAVGVMCHEYGHVLGLPDLYNTGYLQKEGALPEEDGAGIGAWGLMGHGALGWHGDDGPNSFCAWSRMRLGWADVKMERQEEIRLGNVGKTGQISLIPLPNGEYFLLENRQRRGSFYDRQIPGEGLLIWHVTRQDGLRIDLECADGRWSAAGSPLGHQPDRRKGGDNLDFWAHDKDYTQAHAGNLGDGTDPFDGVRYQAFTPETNPSSWSEADEFFIRIEGIRFDKEAVLANVPPVPLMSFDEIRVEDANGDSILVPGENVQIFYHLFHHGQRHTYSKQVKVSTADSLVEIVTPVARGNGPLAVRFTDGCLGVCAATLWLEIQSEWGGQWLGMWREKLVLEAISPRQPVSRVVVIDTLGNDDDVLQAGEIVRLSLELPTDRTDLLPALEFRLRSLDERVHPLEKRVVRFQGPEGYLNRSVHSPEFLLDATVNPGDRLDFEFEVDSGYGIWWDTLSVEAGSGRDQTAPRVLSVHGVQAETDLHFFLPTELVIDGSPIYSAAVRVYSQIDSAGRVDVPLKWVDGNYQGTWAGAEPGGYFVEAWVEDVEGNKGSSVPRLIVVEGQAPEVLDPEDPIVRLYPTPVSAVAYAPDGEWVATANGNRIHLYQPHTLEEEGVLAGNGTQITTLSFSPDGKLLAAGRRDGTIHLWNTALEQEIGTLEGHDGRIEALAFNPNGRQLASAGQDGTVRFWETADFHPIGILTRRQHVDISAVSFSPDSQMLAVGNSEGSIELWTADTHRRLRVLTGHADGVESVAFSADGRWLASGSRDSTLRLWNLFWLTRHSVVLRGHTGGVRTVVFSPDGRMLASGGVDGTVRFWRVGVAEEVAVVEGHRGWVESIAFSPDGLQLASGSADGTVRFWHVPGFAGPGWLPVGTALVELFPPFPNPFNSGVWIPYRLNRTMAMTIRIYNAFGQVVRVLDLGRQPAGRYFGQPHAPFWDGYDDRGESVASGVYLYSIESAEGWMAPRGKKIVFLK
jgi:M6 family metalloprotease-like protein